MSVKPGEARFQWGMLWIQNNCWATELYWESSCLQYIFPYK